MPKTLARSVIARAGMPSAAARATASSMRTIPAVMENSLWSRRGTKAGFGIGLRETGTAKILPRWIAQETRANRTRSLRPHPLRSWKAERKGGVKARFAPYADFSPVQFRDRLDDRQTETRAGRGFLARAAGPIEPVEDAR